MILLKISCLLVCSWPAIHKSHRSECCDVLRRLYLLAYPCLATLSRIAISQRLTQALNTSTHLVYSIYVLRVLGEQYCRNIVVKYGSLNGHAKKVATHLSNLFCSWSGPWVLDISSSGKPCLSADYTTTLHSHIMFSMCT